MSRIGKVIACAALAATCSWQAQAQEAKPPAYSTSKVEGTEGVYVFSFGNRLSMFIVTRDGVIATDPGGYGQPQRVPTYLAEIKKVTDKPIKYLIYSHHHYDHISGGQPFKDAGATIVAHTRAKQRLEQLADPRRRYPTRRSPGTGRSGWGERRSS